MSLGDQSIVKIDSFTAMKSLENGWKINIDVKFPPELWEVVNKGKTFDWKKGNDVPDYVIFACENLESKYADACKNAMSNDDELIKKLDSLLWKSPYDKVYGVVRS